MAIPANEPDQRDKQRTQALMDIAEALKAIQKELGDIRAHTNLIAAKLK